MRNEALAASLLVVRWAIGWVHHVGNEMKISKSKQELASIISENGGWRDGYGFSAQDGDDCAVWFYDNAPVRSSGAWWVTSGSGLGHCGIEDVAKLPNWHQTILSREEYFHLYPAPDAKPTIEQLAADYRNAKDYAERKQKEADNAKADVGAKLKALKLAGKEHGLLVSPITTKQDPELVISDWRDLQVGDEVEARCHAGVLIGLITEMEPKDCDGERPFRFQPFGENTRWCTSSKFKFIRRQ